MNGGPVRARSDAVSLSLVSHPKVCRTDKSGKRDSGLFLGHIGDEFYRSSSAPESRAHP